MALSPLSRFYTMVLGVLASLTLYISQVVRCFSRSVKANHFVQSIGPVFYDCHVQFWPRAVLPPFKFLTWHMQHTPCSCKGPVFSGKASAPETGDVEGHPICSFGRQRNINARREHVLGHLHHRRLLLFSS